MQQRIRLVQRRLARGVIDSMADNYCSNYYTAWLTPAAVEWPIHCCCGIEGEGVPRTGGRKTPYGLNI